MQELEGIVIAHYMLIRHIATGGMSDVYLARDLRTEQEVALKLVPVSNQESCRRFQREARVVAGLQHEDILPALDYGESDNWCYLVMPYIPNGTLRDLTERCPLEPDIAGKYLSQVASALHYAHRQGIIHRDIKASNILMRDTEGVYLADFGLLKNMTNVAESLTETGFLVGTAEYMAPELAEEEATELSDIYALGIVLYQMLTGDVPFKGSTPLGTFMQHLSKRPPCPSLINPDLPAAYDDVVLCALEKEPRRRYQSALELAAAYQRVLDSQRYANDEKTTVLRARASIARMPSFHSNKPHRGFAAAITVVALTSLLLGPSAYMFHDSKSNLTGSLTSGIVQPLINHGDTPTPVSHTGHTEHSGNSGASVSSSLPTLSVQSSNASPAGPSRAPTISVKEKTPTHEGVASPPQGPASPPSNQGKKDKTNNKDKDKKHK